MLSLTSGRDALLTVNTAQITVLESHGGDRLCAWQSHRGCSQVVRGGLKAPEARGIHSFTHHMGHSVGTNTDPPRAPEGLRKAKTK